MVAGFWPRPEVWQAGGVSGFQVSVLDSAADVAARF
jgi:hypothetical protein